MRTGWPTIVAAIVLAVMMMAASGVAYAKKVNAPAAVLKAVKAAFPGATVKDVDKENEGGMLLYEIELVQKGREFEVLVAPDGVIAEVETEIAAKDLPEAVAKAVAQAVPGAKIKEAERIEVRAEVKRGSPPKHVKLAKPKLLYEVEVVKNGKEVELMVAPDGAIVGKWQEDDDGDDDD